MKHLLRIVLILVVAEVAAARASTLDTIGVTLLRATTTNLNGAGVRVGQAEAGYESPTNWEVNPGAVGVATNLFTYIYGTSPYVSVSTANTFPNSIGGESGHSDNVAANYYGIPNGVATNVAHVDNYEANTFINYYVADGHSISERIVNQSFTFGVYSISDDQLYDNYAAQNNVLFVTGAERGGYPVASPATCYNGIGVGAYDAGNSPNGPAPDGRSKPDITAPGFAETSYTTPQVAGAAAILMQAGTRGDGGSDTNSATDIRTVKALLLNGAVKPGNWTNSPSTPLHTIYGAGVLNVFNSYKQLAGGKRSCNFSTNIPAGSAHPPVVTTNSISVLSGWDFNTSTSSSIPTALDGVKHYYFNVTNASADSGFAATITLVWNRQSGQSGVNNLDLFLYNCANSNLVMCSTSRVDNIEHIFLPKLPQGRYDLQVWMSAAGINSVNNSENYALAWTFSSTQLAISKSGTNVNLSWPIYPAGFAVAATANLTSPNWSTNNLPPLIFTNGQNVISIPATNAVQFFRLQTPNF